MVVDLKSLSPDDFAELHVNYTSQIYRKISTDQNSFFMVVFIPIFMAIGTIIYNLRTHSNVIIYAISTFSILYALFLWKKKLVNTAVHLPIEKKDLEIYILHSFSLTLFLVNISLLIFIFIFPYEKLHVFILAYVLACIIAGLLGYFVEKKTFVSKYLHQLDNKGTYAGLIGAVGGAMGVLLFFLLDDIGVIILTTMFTAITLLMVFIFSQNIYDYSKYDEITGFH